MKLEQILALRPQGNNAASIQAAITKAEGARVAAISRAAALEKKMRASLLTATDDEMERAEREAAEAKRAADRIGALLEEMAPMLTAAVEREVAEERARLLTSALEADELYVDAWQELFHQAAELAAQIISAQRAADDAVSQVPNEGQPPDLPRHGFFTMPLPGRTDPRTVIEQLASFAPSEIARREEIAKADAKAWRKRQQVEREDLERRAAARRTRGPIPDLERAQVVITSDAA